MPLILHLVVMIVFFLFLSDLLGASGVGFLGKAGERCVCDLSNLCLLPSLQWRFIFAHFVVEPGQEYEVTVHHLPKPFPHGDPNHQSRNFLVPGKSALPGHCLTTRLCRRNQQVARLPLCLAGRWLPLCACGVSTERTHARGGSSSGHGCSLCCLKAEPVPCWHKRWVLG